MGECKTLYPLIVLILRHPENIVFIILLCIESFLFGLFTLCMLCDQINSVVTNQTYIDRLKDKNNNSKRRRQGQGWWKRFFTHMREVVGDRPRIQDWFCRQHRSGKTWNYCMVFVCRGATGVDMSPFACYQTIANLLKNHNF